MELVLLDSGRSTLAELVMQQQVWLAVGSGDAAWGNLPPAQPVAATALLAPLGLVRLHSGQYVAPDAAGAIATDGGERWTVSATPSMHMMLDFHLAFEDLSEATLRESMLVIGPTLAATVLPGQRVAAWSEVISAGRAFAASRSMPMPRQGVDETLRFIITI